MKSKNIFDKKIKLTEKTFQIHFFSGFNLKLNYIKIILT